MSVLSEQAEGIRLLEGLESGSLNSSDAYNIAKDLDPVHIYFIMRFLREKYPPSNPQSQGVIGRLVELSGTYDDLVKRIQEGEKDIIREWFDDGYTTKQFHSTPEEFIALLIEKIEG